MCQALEKLMEPEIRKAKNGGVNQITTLMAKLFSLGRVKDAEKASNDPEYLHRLFVEFGMAEV